MATSLRTDMHKRIENAEQQISMRRDTAHTILTVLLVFLLIGLTFWILRPFLVSIVWAAIIVTALWPLLATLQRRFAIGRGVAVSLMTTLLLLLFLAPLTFAILTIARNSANITARIRSFNAISLPAPPEWLKSIPIAGEKIDNRWTSFAALSPQERSAKVTPYAQKALRQFVALAGSTGVTIVNFLLTVIFATVLFAKAEVFREGLLSFCRRLAGRRGEEVALLAGMAVRGVVLGVVLTALAQAAIGCVGLCIAGVPAPGLLTAVMFILCLAQLGPLLVMVPSVIWVYASGHAVMGTVLLIFSILAGTIDNILRPILIKKGVDLPLLLIIVGVIGGLIAFGIIGIFIGPVILAVTFTLVKAWVSEGVLMERQVQIPKE